MTNYLNRKPDIKLIGLEIWILGRQFPDSNDYWDGNWVNVIAHCNAHGSRVEVSGSIIHLSEIHYWHQSLETLYETLEGSACLDCMEPELNILIKVQSLGKMEMQVKITPDHLNQKHLFIFELNQSFLPDLIKSCKKIMQNYPLTGFKEASETSLN